MKLHCLVCKCLGYAGIRETGGLVSGKCTSGCVTGKAAPKNNVQGRTICTDSEEKYKHLR